jgi:hypothetical protein
MPPGGSRKDHPAVFLGHRSGTLRPDRCVAYLPEPQIDGYERARRDVVT